jgi:putrescine aminotransferase
MSLPTTNGSRKAAARPAEAERRAILDRYRRHVNSGLAKLAELMDLPIEARSAGSQIVDLEGHAYLDCGGYGVFILGHRHPAVIEAARAQLERHPLSSRVLLNAELAGAAERLASVTPPGLDYVCFTNSGAEAVEAGLKIARLNGRTRFIATDGGFHGKTLGALSVTGRPRYRTPFQDLLLEVAFVPFGDPDALERRLRLDGERAAVILEPVQGEGGVVVPPDGYLSDLRRLCDRYGAFLILDEIQTGLGRLGWWWGADREGVAPDVMLVGKGLSGGAVPVGAAVATAAAFAPLNRDPLLHASTFAGNPLAMAAAQAAIGAIEGEGIVDRARTLGADLLGALRRILGAGCPECVRDVRGLGLLIGIEFETEDLGGEFILELLRHRVVVSTSLNAGRVVRLTPPAILTTAERRWLLDAVEAAAQALRRISASTSTGPRRD